MGWAADLKASNKTEVGMHVVVEPVKQGVQAAAAAAAQQAWRDVGQLDGARPVPIVCLVHHPSFWNQLWKCQLFPHVERIPSVQVGA